MLANPAKASGSNSLCQTTMAWPSTSIPLRPARPVNWVYSPAVTGAWTEPFHFVNFSRTTLLAGMFMPSAKVSVAKTTFTKPSWKSCSTTTLKAGSNPAWCAAIPFSNPSHQEAKPRTRNSSELASGKCASTTPRITSCSSGVVTHRPPARHCDTASSQAALEKMNVMLGNNPARSSSSITSTRDGVYLLLNRLPLP